MPDQNASGQHPAADPPRTGEFRAPAPRKRFRFALKEHEVLSFAVLVLIIVVALLAIAHTLPAYRLVTTVILLMLGLVLLLGGNAVLVDNAYQVAPGHARLRRYVPLYSLFFCLLYWRRLNFQPIIYLCGIVSAVAACSVYAPWFQPIALVIPKGSGMAVAKPEMKPPPKAPAPVPRTFEVTFAEHGYSLTMTVLESQFEEGKPIDARCLTAGKSVGSAFHWTVYKEGIDTPYDESSGDDADRFTFVPDDNGRYLLVMVATASDGKEKRLEQTIEVANVAPPAKIEGIGYPRQEGTAIEMLASATDPAGANDTLTYSWSVYAKSSSVPVASKENVNLDEFSFTPGDNGRYNVVLTVRDEDGGETTVEKSIEVLNLPPAPVITAISSIRAEGSPIEINGKATDPAGQNDTLTYQWSVFKSDSRQPVATDSGVDKQNFIFTPEDDGHYRILLEVSDEDGGSDSTEKSIDVANVAPSGTIVSVGPQCREGAQVQVDAKASAPPARTTRSHTSGR